MRTRDTVIICIALLQIPIGAFLLTRKTPLSLPPAKRLSIAADSVVDSGSTGYTLIEFGDYQCPPCAASQPAVEQFIKKHERSVTFVFRHLPLQSIHPLAMRAALVAEASRPVGDFGRTHKALYALNAMLSDNALNDLEKRYKVDASCHRRIERDERVSRLAGVAQTPTFLLCTPSGVVWQLSRLDQAEAFLPRP